MKHQALFSLKDKCKKIKVISNKVSFAAFCFRSLRVKLNVMK